MLKNKTQTISVSTLVKNYYKYKISCYLMTYPPTNATMICLLEEQET